LSDKLKLKTKLPVIPTMTFPFSFSTGFTVPPGFASDHEEILPSTSECNIKSACAPKFNYMTFAISKFNG